MRLKGGGPFAYSKNCPRGEDGQGEPCRDLSFDNKKLFLLPELSSLTNIIPPLADQDKRLEITKREVEKYFLQKLSAKI